MIFVNVFYVLRNEISVGSDKKMRNFPIDPLVKIAHCGNVMSIDMPFPKWAIFTMGVYWEILCLLSDPVESSFSTTYKTLTHIL